MSSNQNIPFNIAPVLGNEAGYIEQALLNKKLSGDGPFNKRCAQLLAEKLGSLYVNLTPSCTSALEMAYLIIDIQPGDEVILPSYTFTSTATAITLFGAKPVFVDVDKTMNVDCNKIAEAITSKTKAICIVHYAGMSCDFDRLKSICSQHPQKIYVIEDAAQGIEAFYKNKPLGSLGDISAFSFHETKNIVCGEGGAIAINNKDLLDRADIIKDKGTNRQRFLRGQVDKYTWQDKGSSYLLSELSAAFLLAQLESATAITNKRLLLWDRYFSNLASSLKSTPVSFPLVPEYSKHNGHIFYLILPSESERNNLASHLKQNGITAVSHYVPLHSAPAGIRFGEARGSLSVTDDWANRLLRLPMYYDLQVEQVDFICSKVTEYFKV